MTANEDQFAWMDELQQPQELANAAAADLALEVSVILDHAMEARKDLTQQDLAAILGVTPGRVSQVLKGDGNFHVATVARYLRALGYELRLGVEPVDKDAPRLQRSSRKSQNFHLYKTTFANSDGVYENFHVVCTASTDAPVPMGSPQHVKSTVRVAAPKRSYVAEKVVAAPAKEIVDRTKAGVK